MITTDKENDFHRLRIKIFTDKENGFHRLKKDCTQITQINTDYLD